MRGVDLHVGAGEWLGVIGPNGAGKSTLLRALAGLVKHTGTVELQDGRRPAATDVALVPQKPVIPAGMTVTEYVLLGRTAHLGWLARESRSDRRITAGVLERLGLAELADRYLAQLSGGEAQRVIVARALAQEAQVLLLDEPTSALDLGHQGAVLELIDDLRRRDGLSVIAVMHDLTTAARFADRLMLMHQSVIVSTGEPAEILQPALLSSVFGAELAVHVIQGDRVVLPSPRSLQHPPG